MGNRLSWSTSPYLLQHADNPVDWVEWGPDAFAEAVRRDVPVLLSVGYAACHWCHVMAHESFEDPQVAAVMNASFVCVKVDREERPDVDATYMAATQAMTGRGGWPMTVFTTPQGEPFYAGTYFPPRPVAPLPSFRQVLDAVADAWTHRADAVRASAAALTELLARRLDGLGGSADGGSPDGGSGEQGDGAITAEATAVALATLAREHDGTRGGFGGAPKFPPSMVLEWLLRHHARTGAAGALAMAERTWTAMARGGIYDQLAGGFARYAVDAGWVVPHFEKMLYDNALLLRGYAHAWRTTADPLARRVATETADWLLAELRTPEGGFASSLDADSRDARGRVAEGAYYVWTPAELAAVLGADDAAWAAEVWGVTEGGTFEEGASVLQRRRDPDDDERYADVRRRLRAARDRREPPARDDKVVTGWNGLTIAALADAGGLLDRPDWVDAASRAADLLLRLHVRRGASADGSGADGSGAAGTRPTGVRLVRASRAGVAGDVPGLLEDYAHLAEGLLALFSVTGEEGWVAHAGALLDTVLGAFADGRGGFHDTAQDETDPVIARLGRPQELGDGPTPSGTAAAAGALVTYAALTGSARHREAGERALAVLAPIATRFPRAAGWALAVAEAVLDGPREVAVVGPVDLVGDLRRAALRATAPGAVVAVADPAHRPGAVVALLRDRPLVDGRPAAYVCRRFVCELPVVEPADLAAALRGR